MPWAAALVAAGLCLPALGVGLHMDDYAQRMTMLRAPRVLTEPLAVFASLPGDPELNRRYMDLGILPWWTVPDYRLAFSRILSAVSMWIDYRLWPDSPVLMHAHSLLWLGLMVLVAALLYRRLLDAWSAGLAALLYAFDEAHAMPTAWLANRNALIATALGLLALLAHDRWRRYGRRWGAAASAGCLALALLSGEAALGAAGYLAAYALILEDGSWSRRLGSLLPAGAVVSVDRKGQPVDLIFRFPVPLEDPSLRWITWKGRGFVPFTPPAVGESVVVPVPPGAIGLSLGG